MIIKQKSVFLKEGIDPKILTEFGFVTFNGESYELGSIGASALVWYPNTRRFVYRTASWFKDGNAKKTKKMLGPLFEKGLVEIKPYYYWLAIIGRWQDYPPEKWERIEAKLDKLNGMEEN